MEKLIGCSGCGGFLGPSDVACPHCDAPLPPARRKRWVVLLGLAGSASLGLTMMACYGAPCTNNAKCAEPPDANSDATPDGGSAD